MHSLSSKTSYILLSAILALLTVYSISALSITPTQQRNLLLPDLNGYSMQEGFQIKWISGHSQELVKIANNIFNLKPSIESHLYLIGHNVQFTSNGLDCQHFFRQQNIIKDAYASQIQSLFKQSSLADLNFENCSFTAHIGEDSLYSEQVNVHKSQARWKLLNEFGTTVKNLRSEISYTATAFYDKADLSIGGQVKLNLDQMPIQTGFLKFVRLSPGSKKLERVITIQANGEFTADNLASGNYKILFGNHDNDITTSIITSININRQTLPLELNIKFHTRYDLKLEYNKIGTDIKIEGQLHWPNINIALPFGLAAADTSNNLDSLPHFIGDFNARVRFDRNGNLLTLPYADDNLDQLVFLSWNHQATTQQLTGSYHENQCHLRDMQDNRLYLSATLKPTLYGPWQLPAKKIYMNWSLTYQCGLNHGQDLQSIPLPNTPTGTTNELGEIQAEMTNEILSKIKQAKSFVVYWKFLDLADQTDVDVKLIATPVRN